MEPMRCVCLIKLEPFSNFGSDAGPTFGELCRNTRAKGWPREGEELCSAPRESQLLAKAPCARRGCAIGCPPCHITATNTQSCLHARQHPATPQLQNGVWPLLRELGKVWQETFKWAEILALHGLRNKGGSCWHQPKLDRLDVCTRLLLLCSHSVHTQIHRAYTNMHWPTHTGNLTLPLHPRGRYFLCIRVFWWSGDVQQLILP